MHGQKTLKFKNAYLLATKGALYVEEKRRKTKVFYLTMLSILRLYGIIHGIRMKNEYGEFV
jgi:hypothetical protein